MLRKLTVLAAAVAALALAASAQAQPNVVVIVSDDQRAHTMGWKWTPETWRLIRRHGVVYGNAHAPTSVCCPSRASILTGLFAHSHGVYGNGGVHGGGWPQFQANGMEQRTIAAALDAAGYHTGLVGKYLNEWQPGYTPPGWDVFKAFNGGYLLARGADIGYSTDVLRDEAVDFIHTTPAEEPLFLYFAPYAPHSGSIAAARHAHRFDGMRARRTRAFTAPLRGKPPWIGGKRTTADWFQNVQERRAETMLAVDEAVGAIGRALADTGRLSDTLIIYLSDNGILLGEHRVYGNKNLPYRASTHIPMVARWDGHLPAGRTTWKPALTVDVAPTIADAAGVPFAAEGRNLAAPPRRGFVLEGQNWVHTQRFRTPAFCGYRYGPFMFARYATGFEELYDYRHDRHEVRNMAGRRPYKAATRSMRARAMRACDPRPPGW